MTDKKGKYGALIQQARAGSQPSGKPEDQKARSGDQTDGFPDDQITSEPGNQADGLPENQIARKPETQGATPMQKPRQAENHFSGKPGNQKNGSLANQMEREREVNLTVKVPESLRRHWAAEAKRQGITMTQVITEALLERFGQP